MVLMLGWLSDSCPAYFVLKVPFVSAAMISRMLCAMKAQVHAVASRKGEEDLLLGLFLPIGTP